MIAAFLISVVAALGGALHDMVSGTDDVRPSAGFDVIARTSITTEGDNTKPFVVARPEGGLYLAWAQRLEERTAVFLARSTDGRRFDPPVRLSPVAMDLDLGAENGPNLAVDSQGTDFVVWAAGSCTASKSRNPAETAKTKSGNSAKPIAAFEDAPRIGRRDIASSQFQLLEATCNKCHSHCRD